MAAKIPVIKLTSAHGLGRNILYRVSRAARTPDEIVRYEVPRNAMGGKKLREARGREIEKRRKEKREREQWLHYKPPAKSWMATCSSSTDRASTLERLARLLWWDSIIPGAVGIVLADSGKRKFLPKVKSHGLNLSFPIYPWTNDFVANSETVATCN